MAVIPERSLKQLFDLNKAFWASVSASGMAQSVKSMIYQHLQSLWTPNALAVVISPVGGAADNPMLGQSVFNLGGIQWYYPSLQFWLAHAQRSHPPQGRGCDPDVHSNFLTAQGSSPEFQYAVVARSGELNIQDAQAFNVECAYWLSGTEE